MIYYEVQEQLIPKDLLDISNTQIQDHWNLYKGYVTQVNNLNEELKKLDLTSLLYADRRRRLGFEYNGMILHEYYFGNLKAGENEPQNSAFYKAVQKSFGSYETWKTNFEQAGKTRGIGWAIVYCDPMTGQLTNNFIQEHENGNITGFQPILVMDVWEHAYMIDHNASGRGKYIAAFMKNINWDKVEERFSDTTSSKIHKRW